MSDRETRMMARIRREDEARRAQRDQITTYGLVAVIVTFGGARYAGHRSIERACLALLGAFGLYAVAVRCGVPEMLPEYCVNGVDAGLERDRLRTTHRSRWPPWAPTPSPSCGCPSPTPTARTTTTVIFMRGASRAPTRKRRMHGVVGRTTKILKHNSHHAGSISSSDSEDEGRLKQS